MRLLLAVLIGLAAGCQQRRPSGAEFTARVNAFVDAWHDDAAHARPAFARPQVRSSMGILQASGVVRPAADSFEIVHYRLSIAVPNDVIPQVTGAIKAFETK